MIALLARSAAAAHSLRTATVRSSFVNKRQTNCTFISTAMLICGKNSIRSHETPKTYASMNAGGYAHTHARSRTRAPEWLLPLRQVCANHPLDFGATHRTRASRRQHRRAALTRAHVTARVEQRVFGLVHANETRIVARRGRAGTGSRSTRSSTSRFSHFHGGAA
jgi:hypothetical protein